MGFLSGRLLVGILLVLHVYGAHGNVDIFRVGLNQINRDAPPLTPTFGLQSLNRSSFPKGFVFGAATASYQVEGGWNVDGKGVSNWDYFTHKYPEKIANRSNGDVADDSYHRYKDDVKLLKDMNADSYRFSISWSRVVPTGKVSKGINRKGIQYYNNLINELLKNGLTPAVTLFHWELPQALEDEYKGFLSPKIIKDFHDFADVCFREFGDRVKIWITFNEPFTYSQFGYDSGLTSPGRCSPWVDKTCVGGDSATEPYIVTHYQLLAHADVVQLYRTKYQAKQKGKIGMTNVAIWMVPLTNSSYDARAARRALDFMYGWFVNPIVYGDYPTTMKAIVGKRLPKFTPAQSKLLAGSYDFHGLNYYTALYASRPTTPPNTAQVRYITDNHVDLSATRNGVLIGEQAGSDWLHIYPSGIQSLLEYVKQHYKDPEIYITENGVDEVNNPRLSLEQSLQDSFRIQFYYRHLQYVRNAIKNGVKVRGYYGWSLIDNFEWQNAYTVRFGINFVNYTTLERFPKLSARWFRQFLHE
ncbi:OLC1v1024619C1 [Oldenlandia corymbosa var. corymbosa]|uniref:OLC1v1024619C1 n=1 Tax=Oldenlandia corymbosa var. corymbosa TaxID=529605 RepID=A0AAV1C3Q2_OLDCO|nr:OLC1v1024619C1 [Oldenlandia corymbosa var. corymbosa]